MLIFRQPWFTFDVRVDGVLYSAIVPKKLLFPQYRRARDPTPLALRSLAIMQDACRLSSDDPWSYITKGRRGEDMVKFSFDLGGIKRDGGISGSAYRLQPDGGWTRNYRILIERTGHVGGPIFLRRAIAAAIGPQFSAPTAVWSGERRVRVSAD